MDGRTHVHTVHMHGRTDKHMRPALLGQLCQRVDIKITIIKDLD